MNVCAQYIIVINMNLEADVYHLISSPSGLPSQWRKIQQSWKAMAIKHRLVFKPFWIGNMSDIFLPGICYRFSQRATSHTKLRVTLYPAFHRPNRSNVLFTLPLNNILQTGYPEEGWSWSLLIVGGMKPFSVKLPASS
jgi:hypothetical protein